MVAQQIRFSNAQLEVKDIEEFALYPTNVTLPKYAGADCPVNVLQRRVIKILGRDDQCTQKYSLEGPLLESYMEMRLGSVDIDKRSQNNRHRYFGAAQDCGGKRSELG